MKIILGTLAVAMLAGSAFAQETPPEDVIVQGRTLETTRAYVEAISVTSDAAGVLGRWNQRICPGVVGISAVGAQTIIDQIARRARAVGVRTDGAGCRPNVSIIVTADANGMARDINERRHGMLVGPNGIESTSLGAAALASFINTQRPIRWWHVTQTTMADGHVLNDNENGALQGNGAASAAATQAFAAGHGSGGGEGMSGADVTRSDGTRLRRATRQDFSFVLIIVDANRVGGASLPAIADYVAFVTLAEINPNVDEISYPSILNLFNANATQPRPTGMTSWDLAYLDGLYHMTRNGRSLIQQKDEISRRIADAHE